MVHYTNSLAQPSAARSSELLSGDQNQHRDSAGDPDFDNIDQRHDAGDGEQYAHEPGHCAGV